MRKRVSLCWKTGCCVMITQQSNISLTWAGIYTRGAAVRQTQSETAVQKRKKGEKSLVMSKGRQPGRKVRRKWEREGRVEVGGWEEREIERAACLAFSLNSEFCNFQSQRLRDLTSATRGVCSHRQSIHKEKKRGRHCVQRWLEALHLLTEKLQQMDTKFPQTGQNSSVRTGR